MMQGRRNEEEGGKRGRKETERREGERRLIPSPTSRRFIIWSRDNTISSFNSLTKIPRCMREGLARGGCNGEAGQVPLGPHVF